jgi:16S rRNA (uracil1498-N3)-methyltransferase
MRDNDHYLFYGDFVTDVDDTITLSESEMLHAVSVLRIKAGQPIRITDGFGAIYDCRCAEILKRSMDCTIQSKTLVPRLAPELTLLAGIPDKDHFETMLEHATALGVARIIPLIMDRCSKRWWGSWRKQYSRFVLKMAASMKQCLYPYIPQLDEPISLHEIIGTCEKPIIVADPHGKILHDEDISAHRKLTCLVGPPGGVSPDELQLIQQHNPLMVKLAPTRLRTELAATVLCSRIMMAAS